MATFETAILVCVIGLVVMIYSKLMLGWIYEFRKKSNQQAMGIITKTMEALGKSLTDLYDNLSKKEEEKKTRVSYANFKKDLEKDEEEIPMPWDE